MTGGDYSRRQLIAVSLAAAAGAALPFPLLAAPALTAPRRFDLHALDGRAIAISEWLPRQRPRGIILFSHGALSSPRLYEAIIAPWVSAGFRVLAPLHVDSAEHPDTAKFPGLASWKARIEDMRALSAHVGNRHLDGFGAMGMCAGALAPHLRFADDGVHLLLCVLGCPHAFLFSQNPGTGAEFDHVGTVLQQTLDFRRVALHAHRGAERP